MCMMLDNKCNRTSRIMYRHAYTKISVTGSTD